MISAVNTLEDNLFEMLTGKNTIKGFFLCVFFGGAGGVTFVMIGWGWGVFFIFCGWVWVILFLFLIGGGGIFTFIKLTGSGGHHNCFLGVGGCKKVPPALPL